MAISTVPLNFESITSEGCGLFDDYEVEIISSFESRVSNATNSNIPKASYDFAGALLNMIAIHPRQWKGEEYVKGSWRVILYIACSLPPQHPAQDVLAGTIAKLAQDQPDWKDLPNLSLNIREFWNQSPTFELDSANDGLQLSFNEWISLNSFVARLFADRLAQLGNFAIFELRNGLEEDDEDTKQVPVAEARIRTACEWVTKGGLLLLQESLNNTFRDSPGGPNQGTPYRPGVLFKGIKGFNLERWGFWKRRFAELRREHESLKDDIDKALTEMDRVEALIASKSLD